MIVNEKYLKLYVNEKYLKLYDKKKSEDKTMQKDKCEKETIGAADQREIRK